MQSKVIMFLCCIMLIGGGLTLLLAVQEGRHDPARQGIAVFAIIFAVIRLWMESRKPARPAG